jgi:hypothetical protein
MKLKEAVRLAIESIEAEIKTLNFDANVHDQLGADYAAAVKASARRKKLREVIEVLRSETSE